MKKIRIILFLFLGLTACKQTVIQPKQVFPTEYTLAWEERYGHCYDSIPYAVTALDLYSDGLSLDSTHRIQGTGYNLYLSDIFLLEGIDSLVAGTYTSDSTAQPFTFLPGRDYEGTPSGIYLLSIENGKLQSILLFHSGTMVVQETANGMKDIQFTLHYTNADHAEVSYETHFQGILTLWQKR